MIGVCYSRFGHLHLTRNARYTQNTVLNVLMPSLIHPTGTAEHDSWHEPLVSTKELSAVN